jgi:2-methylisocitrate lyase-like PEP mutase family enzyme
VDRETYYGRLRAAVAARDALQSDIVIIARTDSRQTYGFDEAIERLQEAVKIGVDAVFLEALQSKEEMENVCDIMKGTPVLLNNVSGGVTPEYTTEEIAEMGFRIAIYPGLCLGPVIEAVRKEMQTLQNTGKSGPREGSSGPKDAFNLCGLQECLEIDQKAGGKAYSTLKS